MPLLRRCEPQGGNCGFRKHEKKQRENVTQRASGWRLATHGPTPLKQFGQTGFEVGMLQLKIQQSEHFVVADAL